MPTGHVEARALAPNVRSRPLGKRWASALLQGPSPNLPPQYRRCVTVNSQVVLVDELQGQSFQ
jgi:hypothetical protein